MSFEKKLANYRAQKDREEFVEKANEKLKSFFRLRSRKMNSDTEATENAILIENTDQELEVSSNTDSEDLNCGCTYMRIVTYVLYFILWSTLFAIFIKLQFGIVFLIVSALVGMYWNTRTGPKHRNEVSAYSVFNKNCKSIDGTLKAEQFEREIRYGSGAVR